MKNKKCLGIISLLLLIIGVGICFAVSIFFNNDVEVRIERAGVCNPLKPLKDKEVKIDDEDKEKLAKYWKKTDKDKAPAANELVDSLVGDYKLFVGEDTILFNLDLGYVSYNGKYVDINEYFINDLSKIVRENDVNLKEEDKVENPKDNVGESDCCSCCPDLKPGESCIALCCPC